MKNNLAYPHLTLDKDGTVLISASRYPVAHLAAEHYHYGWTAEELLRQHPDLRPEEVYAALTYFYDHFEEIVLSLKASLHRTESMKFRTPVSREELLRRQESKSEKN
jgi:uncharacterized protein (DUF433 family)